MTFNEHDEQIINEAVERMLRYLPSVVGNLIKQAGTLKSLSDKFYQRNSDFAEHRDLVAKFVEKEEAKNPGVGFDEVLKKAEPKIRRYLSEKLDDGGHKRPSVSELDESLNGVL